MSRSQDRVARVGELFGAIVHDSEEAVAGRVHDVRLVRDGPGQGLFGPAYRLQGLVIGPASIGDRLGFDRADTRGPWALKAPFERFHRNARFVEWALIESLTEAEIRLNVTAARLPSVPALTE